MVTNFEDITPNITDAEKQLIPYLVEGFKSHGKSNPIKAKDIVEKMNVYLASKNIKIKMSEPRLRRCVNHIRTEAIIPLIATSSGYYVSWDPQIINLQIQSLYERASAIRKCADGLYFLANKATL